MTFDYHASGIKTCLEDLEATADGLSSSQVAARLEKYGANSLPKPKKRSTFLRFLAQFNNVLIYVLLASAVITAALQHFIDTAVVLAVVIANAVIGFIQEGRAEKAMDSIRDLLAPRAAVLRNGDRCGIAAEELVPGDVVLLEAGDKIAADLRLLDANGLQVEEAILTGESVPVDKTTAPVAADAPLGDRSSMAFSGTIVTSGQGRGIVVATGANTEIGRISGLLADVEVLTTPLIQQMDIFAKWLTFLILIVAAALFMFGHFVEHHDFSEMFMAVVGLSVAAIPEGLPAVLTITLAVGVQAMARRNAIVRRLPAIETLGSVSVICTDKTGTLTRNEMMVGAVALAGQHFTLKGSGYAPDGGIFLENAQVNGMEFPALVEFAHAAALCNDASLLQRGDLWTVEGDPMEGALLAMASKIGQEVVSDLSWRQRLDTIPFDSRHKFMATLHETQSGLSDVFVKGAPEQLLAMCAEQRIASGDTEPLNEAFWTTTAERLAGQGQRVLAIATRQIEPECRTLKGADVKGGLILIGLVGLIDPPRPEAIDAVAECRRAGIRVKMITGDHAGTAAAIGRQIGLENPNRVLTGRQLDDMDDSQLAVAISDVDIFARTNPEHKLRLVMAFQSQGIIAAMTGDGVNDAPALKRADAGIAMGRKGCEAAKEAAELVLADDNFASIVAAVREGRTVYDNIKKVISWTLPTSTGEAMTIIVAILFGMTLPVTPIQILWINLITASTLGIALAFEPTEANTMRRPPRPRGEALLTGTLAWHIVFVSLLFLGAVFGIYAYAIDRGYSLELARTMVVNTLVVMEIFHLFFIRNIYGTSLNWKAVVATPVVWLTVCVVVAAQFAITYLPPLQRVFATEAVPLFEGLLILGIGVLLFAIVEIEKQLRLSLASRT